MDPADPTTIKIVTLKTLQQTFGKLANLAMICSNLKSALALVNCEKSRFEKAFDKENNKPGGQQLLSCFLSMKGKEDLLNIRAVLVSLIDHPLPLESYKKVAGITADIFMCGDASGNIEDPNKPAALGVYIPHQLNMEAMALSYLLPREWLLAKNKVDENKECQNKDDTVLLECLSIITPLVEFPNSFKNRSVIYITDNLALSMLYKKMWAKNEATVYFLRLLNFITQSLNIDLEVIWKRRRSDLFTELADDLTHSDFSKIRKTTRNRRISTLPEPLMRALQNSKNMMSHEYGLLETSIKHFWHEQSIKILDCMLY